MSRYFFSVTLAALFGVLVAYSAVQLFQPAGGSLMIVPEVLDASFLSPEPLASPEPAVTLTFVGDLMLDRGVRRSVHENGQDDFNWLFTNLGNLSRADILFGNLEGPLSDVGADRYNLYSFRMSPAAAPALASAGFDVLSLANNHIGDWGREAALDTVDRLKAVGIRPVGLGADYQDVKSPKIIERGGLSIGWLAFTDVGPDWLAASAASAGIIPASDPNLEQIIADAAKQVDHLVVSFHFGDEYRPRSNGRQQTLARAAIDSGARLVVGHHPHVAQEVERYRNGLIAYSLGNFIFDQNFSLETMRGLALTVKLDRQGIVSAETRTVTIDSQFKPVLFSLKSPSAVLQAWRRSLSAGLAYLETITPDDLKTSHAQKRLKVLLVPGHDNEYSGAVYRGVRETDLNLELAGEIKKMLEADDHYQVSLARDLATGNYAPELADYFVANRNAIERFRADHKERFAQLVASGEVAKQSGIYHGYAKEEVSRRLYGINKWANEQDIDVVLHLHFNDAPGRRAGASGKYSGFAVYVPERQYPNSRASIGLGEAVSRQLGKSFALSDLPQENSAVVEDQDLIAIGAAGTRERAAILIEYGYIYEPQFSSQDVRALILPEMAWQTYQGLLSYFDPAGATAFTLLIPRPLTSNLARGEQGKGEILILQKMLEHAGFYPPAGKNWRDCPLNGNFGPCVESAVRAFQVAHGLPSTGIAGPQTRAKLNNFFGYD